MTGADIGLGWIDQAGKLNFEVSLSSTPILLTCVTITRTDMPLATLNRWLTTPLPIGLD